MVAAPVKSVIPARGAGFGMARREDPDLPDKAGQRKRMTMEFVGTEDSHGIQLDAGAAVLLRSPVRYS
jgi:hypothetical protein